MLMENLLKQGSSNSLVNSLYKFIDSTKDQVNDMSTIEKSLLTMKDKFSTGDSEYWVNKILNES